MSSNSSSSQAQLSHVALPKREPPSSSQPACAFTLQRKCACGTHTQSGGECESCRKERSSGQLQRAVNGVGTVDEVPAVVHEVLRSTGQPLDTATRSFFESRFDHDFSQVRVHTDERAAESARSVNALAYTVGRDVVFDAGQYRPDTFEGRRLVAHELAHTIQQSQATVSAPQLSSLEVGEADDSDEREADKVADLVMSGQTPPSTLSQRTGGIARIQRYGNEPNGGCGVCTSDAVTGTLAHTAVEEMFKQKYGRRIIPEAPFVNPSDKENSRLDLLRIIQSPSPPTLVEIGEIKPDNNDGHKDGKRDLEFYRREVQARYPSPLYEVDFMDLPAPTQSEKFNDAPETTCPDQRISVRGTKLGGQRGLYLYSCIPSHSQIDKSCCKDKDKNSQIFLCSSLSDKGLTMDFVDKVLERAQGEVDRYFNEVLDRQMTEAINSMSVEEAVRLLYKFARTQLLEYLKASRTPTSPGGGDMLLSEAVRAALPEDNVVDFIAKQLQAQLKGMAEQTLRLLLLQLKNKIFGKVKTQIKAKLRDYLQESLNALCAGALTITAAQLLKKFFDDMKKFFGRELGDAVAELLREMLLEMGKAIAAPLLVIVAIIVFILLLPEEAIAGVAAALGALARFIIGQLPRLLPGLIPRLAAAQKSDSNKEAVAVADTGARNSAAAV